MKLKLTKTERRNTIIISSAFLFFLLVFNLFLYFIISYQLTATLDNKIRHELEHISSAFKVLNDTIAIVRPSEFQESDLVKLTDNPFFLQIYTKNGRLLLSSNNTKYFNPIPFSYPQFNSSEYFTNTITNKEVVRTLYTKLYSQNNLFIGYIQLSTRKLRLDSAVQNVLYYNLLILPIMLVIIAIASIFISKITLKPINSIIEIANRISAVNLKERLSLDPDPDDEINKLKTTLNNLFERLEGQILQISAFSNNASHQLMTPLTAINAELDFAIKKEIKDEELKNALIVARNQSESMVKIIRSLLIMARSGKDYYDQNHIFSLESLFDNQIKPLFQSSKVNYFIQKDIYIRGRDENFIIVLQNLIDNAVKYSTNNTEVTVIANTIGQNAKIIVKDNGIGIPDNEKQKVFERFYRSEQVQNIGIDGYGLGLSLVKSILLSMNGIIEILDNVPTGTIIIITLPLVKIE